MLLKHFNLADIPAELRPFSTLYRVDAIEAADPLTCRLRQ